MITSSSLCFCHLLFFYPSLSTLRSNFCSTLCSTLYFDRSAATMGPFEYTCRGWWEKESAAASYHPWCAWTECFMMCCALLLHLLWGGTRLEAADPRFRLFRALLIFLRRSSALLRICVLCAPLLQVLHRRRRRFFGRSLLLLPSPTLSPLTLSSLVHGRRVRVRCPRPPCPQRLRGQLRVSPADPLRAAWGPRGQDRGSSELFRDEKAHEGRGRVRHRPLRARGLGGLPRPAAHKGGRC